MTPRPGPLAFLADELAALRERYLWRPSRIMSSAQGPVVSVDWTAVPSAIAVEVEDCLDMWDLARLPEAFADAQGSACCGFASLELSRPIGLIAVRQGSR